MYTVHTINYSIDLLFILLEKCNIRIQKVNLQIKDMFKTSGGKVLKMEETLDLLHCYKIGDYQL